MVEDAVVVGGLSEVHSRLRGLPGELAQKVIEGATRACAAAFAREARSRCAPSIAKSIKVIRLRAAETRGNCVYLVSAGQGSRVAHLIEWGTKRHPIAPNSANRRARSLVQQAQGGASVRSTGRMALRIGDMFAAHVVHRGSKAKPFMTPALESAWEQALSDFVASARASIEALPGGGAQWPA